MTYDDVYCLATNLGLRAQTRYHGGYQLTRSGRGIIIVIADRDYFVRGTNPSEKIRLTPANLIGVILEEWDNL